MALRGTAAHSSVSATTNTITVSGIGIQLNDLVILSALWTNSVQAPTIVQHAVNHGPGGTQQQQATAVFQAFGSNTTAGNAILAFYTLSDFAGIHTDLAAADSSGNTYSAKLSQQNTSQSGGSQTIAAFVAGNIAGGADTVHTYLSTIGDSEDYQANYIIEVGNVAASPLIGNNGSTQNALATGTNNIVSGTVTVSAGQVPCILIGLAANSSGTVAPTVGTGMTLIENTWNFAGVNNLATVAYQKITTPGNYQAVFNQVDVASDMACIAVVLQASTTGAAPTFTLPSGFSTIPGLADQSCSGDETMMGLAYKVATGSEPTTYVVTSSTAGFSTVVCRAYSGRNTVSPFTAVAATANQVNNAPFTYALTGLTPAGSDDVVQFVGNQFYQGSAPNCNAPPGYANALTSFATTTNVPIIGSCDYQGATNGVVTGTNGGLFTCGTLTGLGYCAQQISLAALNPFTLTTVPGAFALTGQIAGLGAGIAAPAGAFLMTGQPALLFVGAAGFQLPAAPGSFFLIGANAAEGLELDGVPGVFALAGLDVGLAGSLFISAAPGQFSIFAGFANLSLVGIGYQPSYALEVYDNLNGSMLLRWGELLSPPANSYNVYVNGVLNQSVTTRSAIVTGLTSASYSSSAVAASSGNSLRPQNMPPTGIATPPGTYLFRVVAVLSGAEVAMIEKLASVGPSSIMLTTPMKRLWPFPNSGID